MLLRVLVLLVIVTASARVIGGDPRTSGPWPRGATGASWSPGDLNPMSWKPDPKLLMSEACLAVPLHLQPACDELVKKWDLCG
jgi:hypothetical protein